MNLPNHKKNSEGTTLIEVLIVIVVLALFVIPYLVIVARLNRSFIKVSQTTTASYYTQKNIEIVTNLAQTSWEDFAPTYAPSDPLDPSSPINTNVFPFTDTYHFQKDTYNEWKLIVGTETVGPYTTQINFNPVCRDQSTLQATSCSNPNVLIDRNSIEAISTTTWTYNGVVQTNQLNSIFTYVF